MDIQFQLTEADYVAAQAAWLMRHPWQVGFRNVYFLVALVAFPVFLGRVAIHPSDWRDTVPGLLVMSLYSIGPILALWWVWRRAFAKLSLAERDLSATVDERGLTLSAEGQHKTHSWTEFSRVFESGRFVFFQKVQGGFLFLPKRMMNIAQLAEIAQVASSVRTCKVKLALPSS